MNQLQVACYSLIASAFILAGLLVVSLGRSVTPEARGAMVLAKEGYTFLVARTRNTEESLFVLDGYNNALLVYNLDRRGNQGRLTLLSARNLATIFPPEAPGGGAVPDGGNVPGRVPR